jgi:leader peptidase (prepilin peptidase) / N-methyltransferase
MWALGLGVLGAILGSFLATLVVRWPEGRSVARGRSACDGCGQTLGAGELVPLLSAAVQRGRCRGCGAAIGAVHHRVELACVAVGASAGWIAPGWEGVAGAAFGWLLVALAALDLLHFWLPDALTAPLAAGGIASAALGFEPPLVDRLIGGAAGFLLLWLVMQGYARVRGRAGMGGGDPKLFAAIGLWLGWRMLPPVLLVACLMGLGVVAVRAAGGRPMARDHALPLGALLAIAAYPAWLVMVAVRP